MLTKISVSYKIERGYSYYLTRIAKVLMPAQPHQPAPEQAA